MQQNTLWSLDPKIFFNFNQFHSLYFMYVNTFFWEEVSTFHQTLKAAHDTKTLRTPDPHYFPPFLKQTTFNNHEKNLVLLHGYMKGQRISTFLYVALSVNHSLHARKSHVLENHLASLLSLSLKIHHYVARPNSQRKFKSLYLKSILVGTLSVVPRKMN